MTYDEFLENKVPCAIDVGTMAVSEPHPSLFPHQRDIAAWAMRGGQRAIFAAFGLGKTRMHLQIAKWIMENEPDKKYLIIAPLGVRHEFTKVDAPAMDMSLTYVRTDDEVQAAESRVLITNYERVRDGGITVTPDRFCGVGLDEASVLRSYGSKTYQNFLKMFAEIPYRYVFTATPSPNKHKELIHYAGFLGIMDTGEALTRFFKRNSQQANELTLYPHMEETFWAWLSTWAVFLQKPSDLGYSDDGYALPPMKIHWHRVAVDHRQAWKQFDSWGQSQLFLDQSSGLRELSEVKRDTIVARTEMAKAIMAGDEPEKHWLLWHDLEAERHFIEKVIPDAKTAYGSQDLEEREELILGFARGEHRILATKPSIAGSGCNFQRYCADAIFLGATYKFNDFIQAAHRIYRFQQSREVNIHIVFSESEEPVIKTLQAKWAKHNELVAKMQDILQKHKLTKELDMNLKRTKGCKRIEVEGDHFRAINNDTTLEMSQWPESSVDLIVTSIPFGNQYEYTPSVNDFGHNPNNAAFFEQMDFLTPQLLRVLQPGRIAAIHCKDRIRFGGVTGLGMPTVDRFSDQVADNFQKHGFAFMGRITIDTDVVRENNQTYRLGWSENAKDGTKMGVGMPEYVMLFRKLPTDLTNAYADVPVAKDKEHYTRADWQVDASSFWKSDGNRMPDPEIMVNMPMDALLNVWREHCRKHGYNYMEHIEVAKALEAKGKLPASFMLFPPISNHPEIWTDIVRMRVLNSQQKRNQQENHVCPLQLDIVERLVRRYSNEGDTVFDPFAGIFTVPYVALKMRRKAIGVELSTEYFTCGVGYCEQADAERSMPSLFDLIDGKLMPIMGGRNGENPATGIHWSKDGPSPIRSAGSGLF